MKVIAFYLPQYHPIPENDLWWGKGFTEWRNVVRGKPLFRGHYQPHIPADLGFYDLRLSETRIAQANLAKQYGIDGFCYYHYWFNGRMLLERPFNEVLQSGEPDFPFCLCWANENWTRRWDGKDKEVLMKQEYDKYDALHHVRWLEQAFNDHRYIKIKGKPLFLIYNAGVIPNLGNVIRIWRNYLMDRGWPGLYLCARIENHQSNLRLIEMGIDAFYDFQPRFFYTHLLGKKDLLSTGVKMILRRELKIKVHSIFPKFRFSKIVNYKKMVKRIISEPQKPYTVWPCVFPSWDNSARRRYDATIIQNSDPSIYSAWLTAAIKYAADQGEDEALVFINAWNEWAEGCHLEPDLRHGHQFLLATKEALDRAKVQIGNSQKSP